MLDAHASIDELTGRFDFGLITLKAPNIPDVLPALRERDLVDVFVSLGNGLVQQRVAAIVGADRLIAGTVEFGATNLGPGHVARPRATRTSSASWRAAPGPDRATARCSRPSPRSGSRTTSRSDLVEAARQLRAVGTRRRGRVLYRDVIEDPAGRAALLAVWGEGYRVGAAQQLELDEVLGIHPTLVADDAGRWTKRCGPSHAARRGDEGLDAPGRGARAAHGGRRHQRRRRGAGARPGLKAPPTRRSSSCARLERGELPVAGALPTRRSPA